METRWSTPLVLGVLVALFFAVYVWQRHEDGQAKDRGVCEARARVEGVEADC